MNKVTKQGISEYSVQLRQKNQEILDEIERDIIPILKNTPLQTSRFCTVSILESSMSDARLAEAGLEKIALGNELPTEQELIALHDHKLYNVKYHLIEIVKGNYSICDDKNVKEQITKLLIGLSESCNQIAAYGLDKTDQITEFVKEELYSAIEAATEKQSEDGDEGTKRVKYSDLSFLVA